MINSESKIHKFKELDLDIEGMTEAEIIKWLGTRIKDYAYKLLENEHHDLKLVTDRETKELYEIARNIKGIQHACYVRTYKQKHKVLEDHWAVDDDWHFNYGCDEFKTQH